MLNGVNTCFLSRSIVNKEGRQKDVWQKDEVRVPHFLPSIFLPAKVSDAVGATSAKLHIIQMPEVFPISSGGCIAVVLNHSPLLMPLIQSESDSKY